MKILLTAINAKYIHSNLAVYSLRASAGKGRDITEIAEYTINHYEQDIIKDIYLKQPDVLAFSCYIWNLEYVKSIARELHKLLPHVAMWVGGPEVSYDAGTFLEENPAFTGVLLGEGEETFRELSEVYLLGGVIEEITGLTLRGAKGEIITTGWRQPLPLQTLPFVYENLEDFTNRIVYYESSRGCPFSCSYCLSSIDKQLRFRDVEQVKGELQFFLDNKVPQVKFVDRTFNCNHKHAMGIWNFILEHDNGITNFHFEIAADLLNQEEIDLLRTMRPGLVKLEIGVQSVNVQTLEAIHRKMDFQKVKEISMKIGERKNIHQHLDLIAGLPYEGFESFRCSFNEVYGCKPQELQLGFLKVLKGSAMHRSAPDYGISYQTKPPYEVYVTKWLTFDEILQIKEVEEMLEIFYNSQQFSHTIADLEESFDSPFALYEALAVFYKQSGLGGKTHSRMNRIHHLRAFAMEQGKEKKEHYEELILRDLYLRENSKSRPEWSKDLSIYKDQIQEFYKQEALSHTYLKLYEGYDWRQMMRMTHVEIFEHEALEGQKKKKGMLLFDYKDRSPLTQNASCHWIEIE